MTSNAFNSLFTNTTNQEVTAPEGGALLKVSLQNAIPVDVSVIQEGLTVAELVTRYADDLEIDADNVTSYKANGESVSSDYIVQPNDSIRAYLQLGTKG